MSRRSCDLKKRSRVLLCNHEKRLGRTGLRTTALLSQRSKLKALGVIAVTPTPTRRLGLKPADGSEQDAKNCGIDKKRRKFVVGWKYEESGADQATEGSQYGPPLPVNRQSPTPAVTLRGEPVSVLIRHGSCSAAPSGRLTSARARPLVRASACMRGLAAIASEYPASLSRPIAAKLLFQPAFDFGGDLLLQICVSVRRAGYCHAHQRVVGNPEVNDKFPGVRWPAKQAAQVIHVRRLVF